MPVTYIEVLTNSAGVVLSTRRIDGDRVTVHSGPSSVTKKRQTDAPDIAFLREAVRKYGATEVARRMGMQRCAVYQWLYRGRVPAKNADKLDMIEAEDNC